LIVRRYLLKEVLISFVAVLTVLLLIFLGNRFASYLGKVVEGELPGEMLLKLLGVIILSSLDVLVPLSLFIAILVSFGRLYKDSEMTAMFANGVSMGDIYRALVYPVFICIVLVATATFYMTPLALEMRYQLKEQAKAQPELAAIQAGGFTQSEDGNWVFYMEQLSSDHEEMQNVFIQGMGKDGLDVYSAASGRQQQNASGDTFLILQDGYRYEGIPGTAGYRIYEYAEAAVRISQKEVVTLSRNRKASSTLQLWRSQDRGDIAELQRRISMPLSALLLSILAVLQSYTTPRDGRYAKLFGAILVYILYNNLLGMSQAWVARGQIIPEIGVWWVHALMVVFIAVLTIKRYGKDWVLAVMMGRSARLGEP
jgi:lipopolysaccharide export system permease protein